MQADAVRGMPVLVSFALRSPFLDDYMPSFSRVILDSGAYSEMTTGVSVDLEAYVEWAQSLPWVDAWAGLDDIGGDWRRSMRNYAAGGFPTFHDTDPDALLDDLIPMARERGRWIGIGLKPPRSGRDEWMRRTLDRIPPDLHVHGWALWAYRHHPRIDSFDSTHPWREWMKFKKSFPWLTTGECHEIAVKKVQRLTRCKAEPTSKEGD